MLAAIIFSTALACKKESTPSQNVSFNNKPLNTVLSALQGRWRGLYYTGESIAGSSQTPVKDTMLGYYTRFYADHITYANKSGDSLYSPVVWNKVAYDNDSLFAFIAPGDRNVVVGNGYAVLSIVNDTLTIGTVNHGIDYGGGIIYRKD